MHRNIRLPLALLVALALAGCAGRLPAPEGSPGGPLAAAAAERFLQLAGERDYVQMGWVFGTADGPVIRQWPLPEVEKRMYAMASVLQHDSFVIGRESPVPGRIGQAVSFSAEILNRGRSFVVPITVVRGPGGRWFVEQVDLQAVTGNR